MAGPVHAVTQHPRHQRHLHRANRLAGFRELEPPCGGRDVGPLAYSRISSEPEIMSSLHVIQELPRGASGSFSPQMKNGTISSFSRI